ncbi:MAG: undecaprenyl-phosphate glucose phosphotransferase [Rhodobiaceae bacterium]|nr:MAG: undecaprenyl-phosphate glucose phosphotransferase [Rhodobiaceae bacterium]
MSVSEQIKGRSSERSEIRNRPGLSSRVIADFVSIADAVTIFTAGCVAHLFYFTFFATGSWQLSLTASFLGAVFSVALFRRQGLYALPRLIRWWERIGRLAASWTLVFLSLATLAFLVKVADAYSRGWAIIWFFVTLVMLLFVRAVIGTVLQHLARQGAVQRHIAIVGCGEQARLLIDRLTAEGELVSIVGAYDLGPGWETSEPYSIPNQGTLDDLIEDVQRQRVDDIILALPRSDEQRIWRVAERLAELPVHVRLAPETFDIKSSQLRDEAVGAVRMSTLLTPPLSDWSRLVKAAEDRVLGAFFLLFMLPAMALIALAIKIDSSGPVFFVQRRHGFNHEIILVLKFRTMSVQEDGQQVVQAKRGDDRITRVGRFLRRTSLDELPQLINVTRGEMSLVGPRPHAVAHNVQYASMINSYSKRHKVKPGITGWAQINGFRGETKELELMQKRIEHDLFYIEHWSLWMDLKIILLTPFRGMIHPNAY